MAQVPEKIRWRESIAHGLSASQFGMALGFCGRVSDFVHYQRHIVGTDLAFTGNDATNHGIRTEAKARCCYEYLLQDRVHEGSFFTSEQRILGCSPDGQIRGKDTNSNDEEGGDTTVIRLLEIKCPRRALYDVAKYPPFGIPLPYLCQMQGQMHIANVAVCDFFMYLETPQCVEIAAYRVYRSDVFWEWARPKLLQVASWIQHGLPSHIDRSFAFAPFPFREGLVVEPLLHPMDLIVREPLMDTQRFPLFFDSNGLPRSSSLAMYDSSRLAALTKLLRVSSVVEQQPQNTELGCGTVAVPPLVGRDGVQWNVESIDFDKSHIELQTAPQSLTSSCPRRVSMTFAEAGAFFEVSVEAMLSQSTQPSQSRHSRNGGSDGLCSSGPEHHPALQPDLLALEQLLTQAPDLVECWIWRENDASEKKESGGDNVLLSPSLVRFPCAPQFLSHSCSIDSAEVEEAHNERDKEKEHSYPSGTDATNLPEASRSSRLASHEKFCFLFLSHATLAFFLDDMKGKHPDTPIDLDEVSSDDEEGNADRRNNPLMESLSMAFSDTLQKLDAEGLSLLVLLVGDTLQQQKDAPTTTVCLGGKPRAVLSLHPSVSFDGIEGILLMPR